MKKETDFTISSVDIEGLQARSKDKEKYLNYGFDAYITKPINGSSVLLYEIVPFCIFPCLSLTFAHSGLSG